MLVSVERWTNMLNFSLQNSTYNDVHSCIFVLLRNLRNLHITFCLKSWISLEGVWNENAFLYFSSLDTIYGLVPVYFYQKCSHL